MLGVARESRSAEPVELSVTAEPKTVYVGDEITFDITVKHLPEVQIFLPGLEANLSPFEVKRYRPLPRHEEGRTVTEGGSYRLTIFELGTHVIPSLAIPYVNYSETGLPSPSLREEQIQGKDRAARRFVKTQPVPIVVRSLLQEKQEVQKPVAGSLKESAASSKVFRLAKGTVAILAGVGFLCLLVYGFFYFSPKAPVYRPPVPAHRIAEKALKEIVRKSRELPSKELYIQLSQVLREYLAGRFEKLNLHLSTGELLSRVREEKGLVSFLPQLSNFFEEVDLVKFAGRPASSEQWESLLQVVQHLVAKTTPKEKEGVS